MFIYYNDNATASPRDNFSHKSRSNLDALAINPSINTTLVRKTHIRMRLWWVSKAISSKVWVQVWCRYDAKNDYTCLFQINKQAAMWRICTSIKTDRIQFYTLIDKNVPNINTISLAATPLPHIVCMVCMIHDK